MKPLPKRRHTQNRCCRETCAPRPVGHAVKIFPYLVDIKANLFYSQSYQPRLVWCTCGNFRVGRRGFDGCLGARIGRVGAVRAWQPDSDADGKERDKDGAGNALQRETGSMPPRERVGCAVYSDRVRVIWVLA